MTTAIVDGFAKRKSLSNTMGTFIPESAATIEDIIDQGGLDWSISKRPLWTTITKESKDSLDGLLPAKEFFAIVRDDINYVFTTVSSAYTCLSNLECLGILQDLMNDFNVRVSRVGYFNQGASIWVRAKLQENLEINGHTFYQYIKIGWSHDGSERLHARFDYVDAETGLSSSPDIPGTISEISIRHTKSAPGRVIEAQSIMKEQQKHAARYKGIVSSMMTTSCDDFREYMLALFPKSMTEETPDENGVTKKGSREKKVVDELEESYHGLNETVAGSLWGAYMVIQEYAEDKKTTRVHGKGEDEAENDAMRDENRLKSNIKKNGSAMLLKQRAWNVLTKPVLKKD